jgi:hypothetical protein
MIDRSQPATPALVDIDIDDVAPGAARRPILSRPNGHIRSPMVERRRDDAPLPSHGERPSIEMPPLRAFIGPLLWAVVPGLPVLVRVGWQEAAVVGVVAIVIRAVRARASRSSISFADGFLGYSAHNRWPHGVQEDNDVHWNWSSPRPAQPSHHVSG